MERGRGSSRRALAGACSFGAGTVAFALCSPASTGCTTNLVVLTNGAVTTRSCAAYSVAAHLGIGLMVLGGVLLLGYFLIVAVRPKTEPPTAVPPASPRAEPSATPPVEPSVTEPAAPPFVLPPGWYGNPTNPTKPVQWWDGTRLTDAPPGPGE
jgi:hypothetical protein